MDIQYILDLLFKYYPQIAGYAFFLALAVYITYKATTFYIKTSKLHTEFPSVQILLTEIKSSFATLNQVLLEKQVISQSCFSQAKSPRQLNDIGMKLYKDSGADSLFVLVKDELLTELDTKRFDSFLEL